MDARFSAKASFLLGRLLVGGLYLSSGIRNLLDLDKQAAYAAFKGVPLAGAAVLVASLLLVFSGFSILAGFRPRLGVLAIACFLVPVTILMHDFWAMQGLQRVSETYHFLGNVGLLGAALIFLAVPQPWAIGLDEWLAADGTRRDTIGRTSQRPMPADQG